MKKWKYWLELGGILGNDIVVTLWGQCDCVIAGVVCCRDIVTRRMLVK